jgi:glyoxylase-like metal-dependent hydrolase (beta-lactamase superfamily II)
VSDFSLESIGTTRAPSLFISTAPNPGPKTLEGTHTYVLIGESCYIVDPGPDIPEYQRFLARCVTRARGTRPDGILLTHGHPDHSPGAVLLSTLLETPIYGSRDLDRRFLPAKTPVRPIAEGHAFDAGNQRLITMETPGHSADHLAFWLEDDRILFAGDTVLGRGTSLVAPPEGNMRLYMETLGRFQALDPRIICPGHGPLVEDPASKLEQYVAHRNERERQVLEALGESPSTVNELVARLYADVDPRLLDLAAGSVSAQLQKLEEEGRVRAWGSRYVLS